MYTRAPRTAAGGTQVILKNGLLGVAYHEERALTQEAVLPPRCAVHSGNSEQDLGLYRIGVLEFVDEDVTIALAKCATHSIMLAHQPARLLYEIVEVEYGSIRLASGCCLQ